jgi:hypothetical protein
MWFATAGAVTVARVPSTATERIVRMITEGPPGSIEASEGSDEG